MSCAPKNNAILAAAGARKTEHIVESALAVRDGRVLITTYTNENTQHIANRIKDKAGVIPPHITVTGWFTFLISQCAKPFQRELTKEPFRIRGLNFEGERRRFEKKSEVNKYFLDKHNDMYRNGVSDFVVELNSKTDGAVVQRLETLYSHVFVDEAQDLSGYDLDLIDLLFGSAIAVTLVGDPRQYTLSTTTSPRNKKYRGTGFSQWLSERAAVCATEVRSHSYRCNQAICEFADGIFPDMGRTTSAVTECTGHDGIFQIKWAEIPNYYQQYSPVTVLRWNCETNTQGLPAMNIGVSKGRTFDRVIIFPTKPMRDYLEHLDPMKLTSREKLYVAVTRARYSVAFVGEKEKSSVKKAKR